MAAPSDETFWEKTKKTSKAGFDKVWQSLDKLGAPVNRLSNKLGSEAFWPTSLDKESDKAARILRSFCKDGFYAEEDTAPADGPKRKQKVLKKIPTEVISKAVGLCIFTTMRTGLWISGSGGSGVLVARQEDGSWSPPSGILLHTAGVGFLAGVDIYDCVIVINNRKALAGFAKMRLTLGGEISAVAGPAGVGGIVDSEVHRRQSPLFTYIKSRGLYAGVQVDGTVVIERADENERFYGERLSAQDIVSGHAKHPPVEIKKLQETLKAAEGGENVDESLIPNERPPGDYEVEGDAEDGTTHVFGVPDEEDPDPYGVHALESEGMEIREAGTRAKPPEEEFEFKPTVTSPVNTTFQPAIDAARTRRDTVTSQTSPKIGTTSSRASESSAKPPLESQVPMPITEEDKPLPPAPPTLPSRDAQAKPDDTDDIAEQRTDEEHFEKVGATVEEAATTAKAPENQPKIELKDEETPVESDLAEVSLEENRIKDEKREEDIKDL